MLWIGLALADPEGERIAEELPKLARDGQWVAIERQYVRLVREHPSALSGPVHLLGAAAAKGRGELLLGAQRLQRVPPGQEGHPEAVSDLEALARTTGVVMVEARRGALLEPEAMPFAPELRRAVEAAAAQLRERGSFVGLLPAGSYRVDGRAFQVHPGVRGISVVRAR